MAGIWDLVKKSHTARTIAIGGPLAWCLTEIAATVEGPLYLPRWFDTAVIVSALIVLIAFVVIAIVRDLKMFGLAPRSRGKFDLHAFDSAADDPLFHKFVRKLYASESLLSFGHHKYACSVIEAPPSQQSDPNSILESSLTESSASSPSAVKFPAYRDAVLELAQADPQSTYDGEKFVLERVISVDPLRIACSRGFYFDALESCDGLKFELQMAWANARKDLVRKQLRASPLRQRVHELSGGVTTNGQGRTAALAIATLICFRDTTQQGGFTCRLLKRSDKKLAVDRARWHVAPAGMFEPSASGHSGTFSVQENVYREYVEELYGEEEPDGNEDPYWYKNTQGYMTLEKLLCSGGAQLYLTGLAVNLLNLRPEICTLLLFSSEEWFESELQGKTVHGGKISRNWEYQKKVARDIPLGDEASIARQFPDLAPTEMVVPGAAAFALGFRLARRLTAN